MKRYFLILLALMILLPFYNNSAEIDNKKITVLTKPLGSSEHPWEHKALMNSIFRGFKALNISFNYNIEQEKDLGDILWVVTNAQALRQAIKLKKEGFCKLLLAGPNLVVLPHEEPLLRDPLIDAIIINSYETKALYAQDEPLIEDRLHIWFAGVDTNYWQPSNNNKNNNVLVYWKTEHESFCCAVEALLRKHGWNPLRIRYGDYALSSFKELLNQSRFAVFISKSESQGIALAEAWAMNVPTFPWNPKNWSYKDFHFPLSSCPYLNLQLGESWKTLDEFELILMNIIAKLDSFIPRTWVKNHMSDEKSAECFLHCIETLCMKKGLS